MTDHTLRAEAPAGLAGRAAMPWLFAAGAYLLLLTMAPRLLNDPDTYWHLAVAQWILDHRAFPTADPFSHTAAGAPWIAFEWLSEMAYAGAFAVAGWPGVAVLAAACIALAFGLAGYFLTRELDTVPALILLVAAFVLVSPHLLARPHVIVMPVMVAWVAIIVRTMDRRGAPPFAALPLLILWANLHGSVSFGVFLIGAAALEALWGAPRRDWLRIAGPWVLFGLLALVAASLTIYGPGILLIPLETFSAGKALATIAEWRPQDFGQIGAFELILLAAIGYALLRGLTLPPVRILVLLGLLHLALFQSRHADLLALFAPLYLARPLGRQLGAADAQDDASSRGPARALIGAALAATVATAFALTRDLAPDPKRTPRAAIEATDLAHAGPVLNDYGFGGYLIYAGIAPFIDGRSEVYGGRMLLRHTRALTLEDLPDFLRLLDEYRIGATLLAPSTPAVALLDRLPEWKRVHTDDVAVVHRRQGPLPEKPTPAR